MERLSCGRYCTKYLHALSQSSLRILLDKDLYFHFTDRETEVQRARLKDKCRAGLWIWAGLTSKQAQSSWFMASCKERWGKNDASLLSTA